MFSALSGHRGEWRTAKFESGIAFAGLVAVAAALWWWVTRHTELRVAWAGLSPALFVGLERHPDWFSNGFPSGAEELAKSAQMLLYLLTDRMGIPITMAMQGMTALEIAMLASGAVWASRLLDPKASWTVAGLISLFLISSHLSQPNFGHWGSPFYGWNYNTAYACFLVGIAAAVRNRLYLAAVSLSLCVWIHVILGGFAIVFAAAAVSANLGQYRPRDLITAGVIGAILAGAWLAYIASTSVVGGGGIPNESFIAFTRLMGYHWFPIDVGTFWERQWDTLIPFLSVAVLFIVYWPNRPDGLAEVSRQIGAGCLAMLVLTVLGVWASRDFPQPFLIKLALQHSSILISIFAVFFIIPGLWRDATVHRNILRAAIAALTLIAPFFVPSGVPLASALLLGVFVLWERTRASGWQSREFVMAACLAAGAGIAAFYFLAGLAPGWRDPAYTGVGLIVASTASIVFVALLVIATTLRRWMPLSIILLPVLAVSAVIWGKTLDEFSDPQLRAKAHDYMAAQQWAHDNTPTGTLFMPDPVHYYGWRDVSLRPSFGSVREWLYGAWIYNSRKAVFDSGVDRLHALGLSEGRYINLNGKRPIDRQRELNADLQKAYYSLDLSGFRLLAQKYGIKYFVIDKNFRSQVPLNIAFENSNYLIGSIKSGN